MSNVVPLGSKAAEFVPGDIVAVKSGGAALTVVNANKDGTYAVLWFDEGGLWESSVPAVVLRKVDSWP